MTLTNPPSIIVDNACLNYAGEILFENLSCVIPASKTTCLLGPSGVGKTSLLRMIASLTNTNTAAKTNIFASDKQPLDHRIAYMAQNDLLLPWLSLLENILVGKRLRGEKITKKHKETALHLLKQVHLIDVANKRPMELSGGMKQRAALARTLFENKPVILMDEPFASLDTITRIELQELTAVLLQNRTVLLVTHDPLEALRIGHYVHVMSGTPATLDKPLKLAGKIPRDPGDPEVMINQVELLHRLTKAKNILTETSKE